MLESTRDEAVYHLADPEAFEAARRVGEIWSPPSLTSEGFVHLSTWPQLRGTLAAHYAGFARLVLLEFDAAALGPILRYETSRGGALFPHLYRPLRFDEIRAEWLLERRGQAVTGAAGKSESL